MTADAAIGAEILDWPDRLEAACVGTRFRAELVRVVARCDSTQDLARALGSGAVVTTGRQVAGRGRLGRRWVDDAGAGIALSLSVEPADPVRLSLAAGLAAFDAVADVCPDAANRLGLKFPNDLVDRVTTRKVGGVLVEADATTAVVGVGINIAARAWPDELAAIAVADLVAGTPPSRIEVLERLPGRLDAALACPAESLVERFRALHAPTGTRVVVETPTGTVSGRLEDLDPRGHLEISGDAGARYRPPAVGARIVSWASTASRA